MKKNRVLLFAAACFIFTNTAWAQSSNQLSTENKIKIVEKRGWKNLLALPMEISSSTVREKRDHPKAWPVTVFPTTVTNCVYRMVSATNDILLHPFVVPFTNNIVPWTDSLGLPEYPWQVDYE
jgi:hypothetical protein